MSENWMCTRGTNHAHVIRDGKSICGSGTHFEACDMTKLLDKDKCKKCKAKLEGSGTK